MTYPFEFKLFGPLGSVALATAEGHATRGATPNRTAGPYLLVVLSQGTIARPHDVLDVFDLLDEHSAQGGPLEGLIDTETVAVSTGETALHGEGE